MMMGPQFVDAVVGVVVGSWAVVVAAVAAVKTGVVVGGAEMGPWTAVVATIAEARMKAVLVAGEERG